ncbi:DAK2 domain-containing protein [Rubneribacter badeniensis]|uniref:DAK2 domain-containing protein n=1 Tax=Rubneribacter badeniensis TaxID=2070688 RepID=A0A2K2U489_9ACTN|nr:DAK2 domain-containing protein [Rubneribacter badeniensis]OUO95739.1 Dak phosphatase [Gordonibacter sp. An232A]PNV65153.1 DAK2 domain-containing protein [Rubneribacter badeniensis]
MIDREAFMRMLEESARLMLEEADRLSDIDSRFGDGDHGVTVAKIAKAMQEAVADDDGSRTLKDFLDDLGMTVMAVRGGSAGPLYGTMIGGLGVGLGEEETDLSTDAARRMFESCLAEMRDITSAQVGDKTMMDALIPAVEAARSCAAADDDAAAVFAAAAEAGAAGAAASEGFASKFGRARSYGDATIGTPDAGAVSTSLFLRGLARGAAQN